MAVKPHRFTKESFLSEKKCVFLVSEQKKGTTYGKNSKPKNFTDSIKTLTW
jgi:hypothetical protein